MAPDVTTRSIASCVAQCLAAFEAIETIEVQAEPGDTHYSSVQTISDQLSRFKLWAGNIGAHRTGRSSLDYRLRDSSHLHTQVMRLLNDLTTSLNEVHSVLSGETIPWDQDPGEMGELDQELKDLLVGEDFEFDSELGQLTKEIADVIGNLLRLSMSLRNPAPHDRFMSTEYAKVRYFEANDKAHVEAKYPRASQTLVIRLGKALSQRRQYFRYRESHHDKLSRGLFDSGRSEADAQSTVASSIPLAMRDSGAIPVYSELDEDERSDTGFSQTSFATTDPGSERLRIPPLPKKSYDGPFECPFCFMLISVSSTYQWRKHVLRDLRPYVCLAEDCPTGSREYSRRHELTNHMLQKHWKSWLCPYQCGSDHTTEKDLHQHVIRAHDGSVTKMELDAMIARCGRSKIPSPSSPVECPLCQDILESVPHYQRHVGRHQVDLALFALPKIADDDEEPDSQNEDQETISTRSGSYSEALSDDMPPTALATDGNDYNTGAQQEMISMQQSALQQQQLAQQDDMENMGINSYINPFAEDYDHSSRRDSPRQRDPPNADNEHLVTTNATNKTRSSGGEDSGEDDITIKVPDGAVVEVGNVKIHAGDGGDINISRTRTSRGDSDRETSIYGDERLLRDDRRSRSDRTSTQIPTNSQAAYAEGLPEPSSEYAATSAVTASSQSALRMQSDTACGNCRRRGIRCSGYINSRGGDCNNCIKMNQICIFDPVSTSGKGIHFKAGGRSSATPSSYGAAVNNEEKRPERTADEERELYEAKKKLDAIRIEKELELDYLKAQEAAFAEKRRRDEEAIEAAERYDKDNAERILLETKEAGERDLEFERRIREELLQSGIEENEVESILTGKKIQEVKKAGEKNVPRVLDGDRPRPTYTRMARRHLSLETLRVYGIDYVIDQDPEYVLIKRWIPETEQDILWRHTRVIREQRDSKLSPTIKDEDPKHELDDAFVWVRKKEHRRSRSRSPALLRYLAGGKPS